MMGSFETKPMPVSHEIKSQLAKLLATEDLVVENKRVSTASFNVHTRVLTLPIWDRASSVVYDLLVGHEVGHALFTPDYDWRCNVKVPHQFVNIVEDVRIEKLIKRKYAGISKTFYNGYKELNQKDFFQISGCDLDTFNLADRANIYFKIGNFVSLNFSEEELKIINLIGACESFSDALIAAEELYKYCKKNKKEKNKPKSVFSESNGESPSEFYDDSFENEEEPDNEFSSENFKDEEINEENSEEEELDGENSEEEELDGENSEEEELDEDYEPEVITVESFDDKIKDLIGNSLTENIYVQIPKVDLNTVINKNSEVHSEIDTFFEKQKEKYSSYAGESKDIYRESDLEFKKFKSSAQKEVNYLVKEFECRKAADQYARASIARTGVLDTARLHTYKYNEDLFKKVSVIPDGKNHGLVFVLDWSGSMSKVLLDTCKQLFNLVWFCKKVSIPFEVYAFTNEWRRGNYDHRKGRCFSMDGKSHHVKEEGFFDVDETFSLMNILSSKVSANSIEHQMLNIWRIAYCMDSSYNNTRHCGYDYPIKLSLSGTPLNESLVALHQILPKFKKENKLQKIHCIILTDGDAPRLNYYRDYQGPYDKKSYLQCDDIVPMSTFLRDRKLGITYRIGSYKHQFTDVILKNLKDNFPYINFIGIRVLSGGKSFSNFISLYYSSIHKEYNKIKEDWKRQKSCVITNSGYDAYFAISSSSLSQDCEFDVDEDSTKTQIKNAFTNSLKNKKLNKKVLGEFISLVA